MSDSDAGNAGSSSSSGSGGGASSSSSGGGDTSVDGGSESDARAKDAAREANAPGCPAAFSDPAPVGNCTLGLSCEYDEGRCKCVGYCGGAPPPQDVDFSHWSCDKPRTDGCPDPKPTAGSTCSSNGKTCSYGDCCIEQMTCASGNWKSLGLSCPP